ncbi:chitin-binding protein [Yersinia mollaretii]|uniref:Chitin-binding protein n=1 Tax=Yersinia mollaretii TaxID=33060 RepID=A0AA44I008_YERMO|nr:lytic polysaccharide monooxygenase [Yersinia mollaretii]NIL22891.1 chitin-binding protein [Yersinia mollaretii]CNI91365.1 N-acetylglucosamine-binding protein A [Yersinia mollaretii]CNK54191.1 N-acetylglucosamine-binding protein A [Yersinia enterocolitica]CQQ65785.1 N-acetylglucosamine-binding protein A [Yersinia mollaretii]
MKYIHANILILTGTLTLSSYFSSLAQAHGYIQSPPSRAYLCYQGINHYCGAVQYEPQSVEGYKNFPYSGPEDGRIASAGMYPFSALDTQSPTRWHKTNVHSGTMNLQWQLTATHSTTHWRYYLTKQGWNSSQPLTRASFDLVPFCQYNDNGRVPNTRVVHQCSLPLDRSGYHVILAAWDIADTNHAFYQVVDINLPH